jgi:hypothetical protein
LNPRERWQRVFHFQKVDRIPNYEFGYWDQLYPEWHAQGLPVEVKDEKAADAYFGLDRKIIVGPPLGLIPSFKARTLRVEDGRRVYQDAEGVICEVHDSGEASIPHYLEFPIKDRASWSCFKERLNPRSPQRQVANMDEIAERCRRSEVPVGINIGSLLGKPRDWTGFEQIALLAYDDPELVDDMVETQCQLIMHGITPFLERIQFDYAAGWEDFCFNNGPLFSPAMLREFLLPRYKRISCLLRQHGVDVIWTDCDGNITEVVDIWLEAGYNCMFPIEVRAGSDPVMLRRKYGKELLLLGGFDKMVLYRDRDAILNELKRLAPVVEEGGFIPHVDHRVPCGVPLDNYLYYHREKRALLGYH